MPPPLDAATADSHKEALPRLAVLWEEVSPAPMQIATSAAGLCRIIFVIGWSPAPITFPLRGFKRLGELVDIAGLTEQQVLETFDRLDLDGVVTFADTAQCLVANLAEHLGLASCSPGAARNLSDKFEQRRALTAAAIPVPAFATLRPSAVLETGLGYGDVNFPAVLKPQCGTGSRDTFRVNDELELRAALEMCDDEDFILEEYIEDRPQPASRVGAGMVSVESAMQRGTIHHVAVTGRFALASPFRETGSFLPSDLRRADMNAVLSLATAAARALGFDHGVLHTEIKMSPSGPRIIEVNGRVGGGIPELLAQVGGPPLLVWAMRLALGLDIGPFADLPTSPVAFFRWMVAPVAATEVLTVGGLPETRALAGVATVTVDRRPGAAVDAREGGALGHVVTLTGKVATYDELRSLQEQIESSLLLTFSSP